LELPETDGNHAQSSAGGMTGKMGMRPFVIMRQMVKDDEPGKSHILTFFQL